MGDNRLPLKVKIGLRDFWENSDCRAKTCLADLESDLGLSINVNTPWYLLWEELGQHHSSAETFVPSIADAIADWALFLNLRLEKGDASRWTDKLLETFGSRSVPVDVETKPVTESDASSKAPSTRLVSIGDEFRFHILIPATSPPFNHFTFEEDFEALFDDVKSPDVASSSQKALPVASEAQNLGPRQSFESNIKALPALDTLPRPEVLLANTPPFHIVVDVSRDKLLVMGSHQPSLMLLYLYLKKWLRDDRNCTPGQDRVRKYNLHSRNERADEGVDEQTKCLTLQLLESSFGHGTLQDGIRIERRTNHSQLWRELNPVLIFAFVEGVLGYDMVTPSGENGRWGFRRKAPYS